MLNTCVIVGLMYKKVLSKISFDPMDAKTMFAIEIAIQIIVDMIECENSPHDDTTSSEQQPQPLELYDELLLQSQSQSQLLQPEQRDDLHLQVKQSPMSSKPHINSPHKKQIPQHRQQRQLYAHSAFEENGSSSSSLDVVFFILLN